MEEIQAAYRICVSMRSFFDSFRSSLNLKQPDEPSTSAVADHLTVYIGHARESELRTEATLNFLSSETAPFPLFLRTLCLPPHIATADHPLPASCVPLPRHTLI
jgi:hypothetical protein